MARLLALALALALALLAAAEPAVAQWKPGGVVLPITPFDDWSAFLPDGAGGIHALFPPVLGTRDVHSQHLFDDGTPDPADGDSGLVVGPGPWGVGDMAAIADGSGGVLVVFQRCAPPQPHTRCWETAEVRLLRSHAGAASPGWPDSGVAIGPATSPAPPPIASDGDGGAVLLLGEAVQRWTGAGAVAWTPEPGRAGVRFATGAPAKLATRLAADGTGGAWVAWSEADLGDPVRKVVRLGHVSASGTRTTGAGGIAVVVGPQLRPNGLAPDGAGGVWLAWGEPSGPFDTVRLQHVDATGLAGWDPAGVPAGRVPPGADVELTAAGDDAVALVVMDAQSAWRVQELAAGSPAFADAPDGRLVGVAGVPLDGMRLASAPDGGLFVYWSDARSGSNDPWATRLDADGQALPGWALAGTALAALPGDEYAVALVPGAGPGEAIAVWSRPSTVYPGLRDLVAQKLVTGGVLSAPHAPASLSLAPPWPNPARDGWTVRFALPGAGRANLELFDVAGRRVWSDRAERPAGANQVRIGARGLAEGVYLLRLRSAAGERTRALARAP